MRPSLAGVLTASLTMATAHAQTKPIDGLRLTCPGVGTHTSDSSTTVMEAGPAGPMSKQITSSSTTAIPGRISVEFQNGGGRIHIPADLLPPIHGGSDGWFQLSKIDASADTINASFAINFINHPRVRIDRHSGDIDFAGFGSLRFQGTCEQSPDESAPAKF